jgi:soluble lytic murein transglycosylase-like protein
VTRRKPSRNSRSLAAVLLLATAGALAEPSQPRPRPTIPPAPDCLDEASSFHRVNPWVLRAIIWHESSNRPRIVVRNQNGSVDVGLGQINTVHFKELGLYNVEPARLLEPCVNTYVSAWLLARAMKQHGNTWESVGAYHSETPSYKWAYVRLIQGVLQRWQILQPPGSPSIYTSPDSSADVATLDRGTAEDRRVEQHP